MKYLFLAIFCSLSYFPAFSQDLGMKMSSAERAPVILSLLGIDNSESLKEARGLLAADSLDYAAISILAEHYRNSGHKDSVVYMAHEIIRKHPDRPEAYVYAGRLLHDDGPAGVWRDYLEKAYRVDTANYDVNFLLGQQYYNLLREELTGNRNKYVLEYCLVKAMKHFGGIFGGSDEYYNCRIWAPYLQLGYHSADTHLIERLEACGTRYEYYFPLTAFRSDYSDDEGSTDEILTGWRKDISADMLGYSQHFSDMSAELYSQYYVALGEPSLYRLTDAEAVRFVLMPSFTPPLLVRLENRDGNVTVYWKKADGVLPGEAGEMTVSGSKPLALSDWKEMLSRLRSEGYWEMPRHSDAGSNDLDGSIWLMEVKAEGKYHLTERMQGYHIWELCLFLAELTGMTLDELYE